MFEKIAINTLIILVVLVIAFLGYAGCISVRKDTACDKACEPDTQMHNECYDDKVICISDDHIYVKKIK